MERFVELDIDVLGADGASDEAARLVVQRLAPLWRPATGVRGLVLNVGWLLDLITECTGDPDQRLPLRSARLDGWARLTYADLAAAVTSLRAAATDEGLRDLRIGPLVLGVGEFVNEIVRLPGDRPSGSDPDPVRAASPLYDERGDFYERHPEMFPFGVSVTLHGPGLDLRRRLVPDTHRYASRPTGIAGGEDFGTFLAEQWAALCELVGFDLLLLRDETTTPVHAGRVSFDGDDRPATASEVREWTDALVGLTRCIKERAPRTHLLLYSSGLSPTVERRFGRLDVTAVVAAGHVDGWVDQTWGGAWQDWWDAGWQGWTFQLANLTARAALIAAGNRDRSTPCTHHKLVQLLDGWEPYDTFHDYPGKLAWGIWAFSHASTPDPHGRDRPPGGTYLAVANDRTGALVTHSEVGWLAGHLDAAETSAAALDRVLGPTVVLQPGTLDGFGAQHASEWVEDYTGFLLKWGVPALRATVTGAVLGGGEANEVGAPAADCDGWIVQAPGRWPSDGPTPPDRSTTVGPPLLFTGRADLLDPSSAARAGITASGAPRPAGYSRGSTTASNLRARSWPYLPPHPDVEAVDGGDPVEVLYDDPSGPVLTRRGEVLWWQPPDVANPADRRLTHYQIGSVDPHVVAARALAAQAVRADRLAVEPVQAHTPVTCHGWVSGGVVHLLLGNLESGWIGDSRYPRDVVVRLPGREVGSVEDPVVVLDDGTVLELSGSTVRIRVPEESMVLAKVLPRDH